MRDENNGSMLGEKRKLADIWQVSSLIVPTMRYFWWAICFLLMKKSRRKAAIEPRLGILLARPTDPNLNFLHSSFTLRTGYDPCRLTGWCLYT